jgi:hypothetical protein
LGDGSIIALTALVGVSLSAATIVGTSLVFLIVFEKRYCMPVIDTSQIERCGVFYRKWIDLPRQK